MALAPSTPNQVRDNEYIIVNDPLKMSLNLGPSTILEPPERQPHAFATSQRPSSNLNAHPNFCENSLLYYGTILNRLCEDSPLHHEQGPSASVSRTHFTL